MELRGDAVHPAQRGAALLGGDGAADLQRHPGGQPGLLRRPLARHLQGRQGCCAQPAAAGGPARPKLLPKELPFDAITGQYTCSFQANSLGRVGGFRLLIQSPCMLLSACSWVTLLGACTVQSLWATPDLKPVAGVLAAILQSAGSAVRSLLQPLWLPCPGCWVEPSHWECYHPCTTRPTARRQDCSPQMPIWGPASLSVAHAVHSCRSPALRVFLTRTSDGDTCWHLPAACSLISCSC